MKLSTIAALITLTGTDAIYYECCKTESEKCPGMMNFKNEIEAVDNYKMCCQPDLSPDKIPTAISPDDIACIDDIDAGNGMSISVMAIGVPEPTTTSGTSNCCEAIAVVEPGKLRSSTGSSCPINMYSIDGAKGPKNNPLCCEVDNTKLDDIDMEAIGACAEVMVTITTEVIDPTQENEGGSTENQEGDSTENQEVESTENEGGESVEGQEGDSAENLTPPQDSESNGSIADAQQALDESNSASAISAAFVVALLGAAIQVAL